MRVSFTHSPLKSGMDLRPVRKSRVAEFVDGDIVGDDWAGVIMSGLREKEFCEVRSMVF